jgi:hypothetical protein
LIDGYVFCSFEYTIPNFFRSFYSGIDRRSHPDKDPMIGLHVCANDFQHPYPVGLSRQGNVKIASLQLEKARQKFGVVDIGAMGRVTVGTWAGMHTYA